MASLKQSTYITEQYGAEDEDAKGTIYYIDIRSIDRFEDFYRKVQNDPKISFVKSKVANIIVDKENNPVVKGVNA